MDRIPVIDLTATGINITRLRIGAGLTVKDVQELFSVSSMTARKDLTDLVQQGYLKEIAINKVTRGYIKMQEG